MRQAEDMVGDLPNVTLYDIPTNDAWIRDYGPTFLQRLDEPDVAIVDWQFNSWGGKYPPWDLDNGVSKQIAKQLGLLRFASPVVMEGGSIDGNGRGSILTTRSCLLDARRNSDMNQQDVEEILFHYCGATEVIWLECKPLTGDDTDGHVDQLARFVSEDQIVVAIEHNPHDDNYSSLQDNLRTLHAYSERRSQPLEIITLPMPRAIDFDRQRVPASYCNFLIANHCVLAPLYDDLADKEALRILQSLFPDRAVVGIPARAGMGLGIDTLPDTATTGARGTDS